MLLRRHVLALAAIFLLLSIAALAESADWPLGRYGCEGAGFTPEEISTPLIHSWQFNTYKAGKNTAAPVISNGTLFLCANDHVVAIDADSGVTKWRFPADQSIAGLIKAAPAVHGDTLYVGATDSKLYAINVADGVLRWTYSARGSIRSSLNVSENVVFFGSDDNSVHAVDAVTGESVWRGPFATKDDVAIPSAASMGFIVFASSDGMLYGANCVSGAVRWQYRLPIVPSRSAPVIAAEAVYIAAGNSLYSLGLKTGRLRWVVPFTSEIAAGPAVAEDVASDETDALAGGSSIYVITKAKKLYAVTPNGRSKWTEPVNLPYTSSVPPTIAGNNVIVATDRGSVGAYSAATGKQTWSYSILPAQFATVGGFTGISAPPVIYQKRLYVVTDDGALHCFDSEMPDNHAPETFSLTPARASAMSGSPPIKISAVVFDLASGVDSSSIELSIDGNIVEHSFDATNCIVSHSTSEQSSPKILPDGRHDLVLKARDWSGNQMTESWSFIVDNKLRPPTVPKAPAPAETPRTPAQRDRNWRRQTPTTPTPTPTPGPGPGQIQQPGQDGNNPMPPPPPPPPQPMP